LLLRLIPSRGGVLAGAEPSPAHRLIEVS